MYTVATTIIMPTTLPSSLHQHLKPMYMILTQDGGPGQYTKEYSPDVNVDRVFGIGCKSRGRDE